MAPLGILVEPQQGATYAQVVRFARHAERVGFDTVVTSDHYLRIGGGDPGPGPLDAWLLLAGLARDVPRIRIGTMMSPVTMRHPGNLAVMAAQVDEMSGGRLTLGLGAGWYGPEHRALGLPFPPAAERFDRLTEALEIITGIWRSAPGEPFDFAGRHYRLTGWPALPRPVQRPHPPILLGGTGRRRTPALAARFADEFNVPFAPAADVRVAIERVADECALQRRDPRQMVFSAAVLLCCGDGEALARRVSDSGEPVDVVNRIGAAGPVEVVAAAIDRYLAAGAGRLYAQITNVDDLAHLDLLAEAAALASRDQGVPHVALTTWGTP